MRKILALALLALTAYAAPSPAPPPFSASERKANSDPYQEFPRWHSFINVLNKKDINGVRLVTTEIAGAIDPRGLFHVVGMVPPDIFGGTLEQVVYFDTRSATRRSNGFSEPVNLSQTTDKTVKQPDVAATDDGAVHVVWEQSKFADGGTISDIYYRKREANGTWLAAVNITNNPQVQAPGLIDQFTSPRLAKDNANNLHVVFYRIYQNPIGSINERYIYYALNPQSGGGWTQLVFGTVASNNYPTAAARIALGSLNNDAQIAWDHFSGTENQVKAKAQSMGGWGGDQLVDTLATSGDIGVDSTGAAHFVYIASFTTVAYKKTAAGASEAVSTAVSVSPISPQIVVDSRDQPSVVWKYTENPGPTQKHRLAYALKTGAQWYRQEPILEASRQNLGQVTDPNPDLNWPLNTLRMARDVSDRIFLLEQRSGLCSWTYEPNLGDQDSFTTFPWAPGTSVNVATGNLSCGVNLFSSRGVGFATSMALLYNSLEHDPGTISRGWRHPYEIRITDGTTGSANIVDALTLTLGDGRSVIFRHSSSFGYHLADDEYGYFAQINRTGGGAAGAYVSSTYLLTTKFGIKYSFDVNGRLTKIEDTQSPTPNSINFNYISGLLTSIVDSAPRTTTLQYDGQSRLIKVIDPANGNYDLVYEVTVPAEIGRLQLVKFTSGPSIPTWKFEYHATNDAATGAKKSFLSKIFTPRGQAAVTPFSWALAYWLDGRARSSTEPSVSSIVNETTISADPVATQAKREIGYTDPAPPFSIPNDGVNVPKAEFVNRRGFSTTVEYQYRRSLADKITDAQNSTSQPPGSPGVTKRFFDGYNFFTPVNSVPQFRNIIRLTDARSAVTIYHYFLTGTPAHVKDNVFKVFRPKLFPTTAPASNDPTGDTTNFTPPIEYTYTTDSLNRVASVKDALSNTTSYLYVNGNLTTITYPTVTQAEGPNQDASESFTYDGKGRVTSSTDAETNVTTFQYNDATTGLVTQIFRPGGGNPESFTYNALGNTLTHTRPEGGVTTFVLDGLYRVDTQAAPNTPPADFDYDVDSNVVQVTDPKGNVTTSVHDDIDRLTSTTSPSGTSSFQYDREGNTRKSKDPNGTAGGYFSSRAIFDEVGRTKEGQRIKTAPGTYHVMQFGYDLNGNLLTSTEVGAPNRLTAHTYDARNNMKITTHPIATITDHNCYDDNDNLTLSVRRNTAETGQLGPFKHGTLNEYDQRNRLRKSTQLTSDPDPDGDCVISTITGVITKVVYNKNSSRTKIIDPIGKFMSFVYDGRERYFQTKDGNNVVVSETTYTQNDVRSVFKILNPQTGLLTINQEFFYNAKNELTSEKDAFANTTSYLYDNNGNLTQRTDPALCAVTFAYDSSDRLITQTEDPTGINVVTAFEYDANSNRNKITVFNPATGLNNAVYNFTFDAANRLLTLAYPLAPNESWTYDDFGALKTHTDRNGKTVTFNYDDLGRVLTEVHGTPFNKTITRVYDGASNLKSIDDATVKVDHTYDKLNRQLSASWTVSGAAFKSISYVYDDAGNRSSMTDPELALFTYGYDANNRPTTIIRSAVTHATMGYDTGGRRTSLLFGNGATVQYVYDKKERLTTLKTLSSGNAVISLYNYTYDSRDNRTRVDLVHLGVAIDYTYDCLSRLKSEAWTGSDCPASLSNSFTSTPGGNESALSAEACAAPKAAVNVPAYFALFSYDRGGNRTEISAIDRRSTYVYDAENRLTSESPSVTQKIQLATVTASDTETGFSAATAADGVTIDSTSSSFVWKSTNTAVQHSLELAFTDTGGNPVSQTVGKIVVYVPTTVGGIARFKVQSWTGSVWNDIDVKAVSGATGPTATWYTSNCHQVTFGFLPFATQKVRFLQDAGGGGTSPNVAYLNELEAYAFVSQAAITYTYDSNGNQKTRIQGDMKETYGYDYANRITSYTKENTATMTTLTSFTYLIAPTGDRTNKQDVLANTKEWYMQDGSDVITDYTQSGANPIVLQTSYIQNLTIDSKVARITASTSATHYYVPDALGSVHMLLDSTQGIPNIELTTAWGEKLPGFIGGGPVNNRYGFTQRERDDESSLMHYRARSYDPRLGRFVQSDFLLDLRVYRHYTYVSNNPISWVDPSGLETEADKELEDLLREGETLKADLERMRLQTEALLKRAKEMKGEAAAIRSVLDNARRTLDEEKRAQVRLRSELDSIKAQTAGHAVALHSLKQRLNKAHEAGNEAALALLARLNEANEQWAREERLSRASIQLGKAAVVFASAAFGFPFDPDWIPGMQPGAIVPDDPTTPLTESDHHANDVRGSGGSDKLTLEQAQKIYDNRANAQKYWQANGNRAFVQTAGRGTRDVIIVTPDNQLLSSYRGITTHAVSNLAKNYAWSPFPPSSGSGGSKGTNPKPTTPKK